MKNLILKFKQTDFYRFVISIEYDHLSDNEKMRLMIIKNN